MILILCRWSWGLALLDKEIASGLAQALVPVGASTTSDAASCCGRGALGWWSPCSQRICLPERAGSGAGGAIPPRSAAGRGSAVHPAFLHEARGGVPAVAEAGVLKAGRLERGPLVPRRRRLRLLQDSRAPAHPEGHFASDD